MGQEPAVAHIVELAGRSGTQVKVLPRGHGSAPKGGQQTDRTDKQAPTYVPLKSVLTSST
jgi:hypothetical protein